MGVSAGVGDAVAVGVCVGLAVAVGVAVKVGVRVAVGVLVRIEVDEAITVAVETGPTANTRVASVADEDQCRPAVDRSSGQLPQARDHLSEKRPGNA